MADGVNVVPAPEHDVVDLGAHAHLINNPVFSCSYKAMAKPPFFSGRNCSHADVIRWLFAITNFIAHWPMTELEQISTACTYLSDAALDWAMDQTAFTTFEAFKTSLTAAFAPFNHNIVARERLRTITQTSSAIAYTNTFREVALLVNDLSPAERTNRYIDGLKPNIKLHLRVNNFNTFEEAASMACRIDPHFTSANPAPPPANLAPPLRPPRLNAAAIAPPRPPGPRAPITPEERAHLVNNGGCTYCRKLGHTIADCRLADPSRRPKGPGAQ